MESVEQYLMLVIMMMKLHIFLILTEEKVQQIFYKKCYLIMM